MIKEDNRLGFCGKCKFRINLEQDFGLFINRGANEHPCGSRKSVYPLSCLGFVSQIYFICS